MWTSFAGHRLLPSTAGGTLARFKTAITSLQLWGPRSEFGGVSWNTPRTCPAPGTFLGTPMRHRILRALLVRVRRFRCASHRFATRADTHTPPPLRRIPLEIPRTPIHTIRPCGPPQRASLPTSPSAITTPVPHPCSTRHTNNPLTSTVATTL